MYDVNPATDATYLRFQANAVDATAVNLTITASFGKDIAPDAIVAESAVKSTVCFNTFISPPSLNEYPPLFGFNTSLLIIHILLIFG